MQTTGQTKTPTVKERKNRDTKLRQEIVGNLDRFFAGTPYSVEWVRSGSGKLGISVTYTDFFSERLVSQMMEDVVPSDVTVKLARVYSDKAVAEVLLQEYKRNKVAVVDCYEGQLHPQTVKVFVDRKLSAVEMI